MRDKKNVVDNRLLVIRNGRAVEKWKISLSRPSSIEGNHRTWHFHKAKKRPISENLIATFDNKQAKFENDLIEVENNLQELPENARVRTAVQNLINNAIKLDNRALQAESENKLRRALGLLNASDVLLENADRILDSITGYVENVQHFVDNGFPQEYQRLSQIVDNLSDTAYRTGLKSMLQLAQNAFKDGNYQLAKWYLLRVEDFVGKLKQGIMPWTLPKPSMRRR